MLSHCFAENVFLDPASEFAWDELNETAFLETFFQSLKERMGSDFADYRFYIFSTYSVVATPKSLDINFPRKILIMITDESPSIPLQLQKHYLAIFKAYLPYELKNSNIFPFSVAFVREVPKLGPIPILARPIDIFFSGGFHQGRYSLYEEFHPFFRHLPKPLKGKGSHLFNRPRLSKLLTKFLPKDFSEESDGFRSVIKFTDGFKRGFSPEQYGKLLTESKIVLCPGGYKSPETFRHIEAIRAGAIVISEKLPDTHFYRGAPYVIVGDWTEGLKTARGILLNPELQQTLQQKGIAWYENVCSEWATAKYVQSKINEIAAAAAQHG